MGRVAALLSSTARDGSERQRLGAGVALLVALGGWDAFAGQLPGVGDALDVLVVALVLLPAAFLVVWLLLPVVRGGTPLLLPSAAGLVLLAVVLDLADADAAFNAVKIAAYAVVGFCFLEAFEVLSWVVLVAVIIPWIDAASVYRGPTKVVVEEEPGIFERIAVAFAIPGEDAAARLGPPDVVFFALFLSAAVRFGLRVAWTWIGMAAAVSATLLATYAFDLGGLPALPAVAIGFLAPNADLLWRALRGHGERG